HPPCQRIGALKIVVAGVQLTWLDRSGNRVGSIGASDVAQMADVDLSPMASASQSTERLTAIPMSGSSMLHGEYQHASPSIPRRIGGPVGRPMGAGSCSHPIEGARITCTGNCRAALEPMNCCWNRIRLRYQTIGPPTGGLCCSAKLSMANYGICPNLKQFEHFDSM